MESMDMIKVKISKLLAMATSANENEAALAMSMAQTLIEKHKLSLAELSEAEADLVEEEIIVKDEDPLFAGGRISTWKSTLANYISKVNGCKLVKYTHQGHSVGGERGSKLVIFGRPSDISNTRFLLAYAIIQLTRLAPMGRGKEYANSWYLGAVQGIWQQMSEAKRKVQATASKYALVKLDSRDKDVDRFISGNVGRLRKGNSSHSNINGDAYNRGVSAGLNLDMNNRSRINAHATLGMK